MWSLAVIVTGTASAGQFNCGRLRATSYTIEIDAPRPPDVLLKAKNLQLQWDAHGHTFPYSEQLLQLIAQGLRKEYTIVDKNPDLFLKVSLVAHGAASQKRYTQTAYGHSHEYWESEGGLSLELMVVDKNGHPLDSAPIEVNCQLKRQIATDGNSNGFSPPTDSQLEGSLLDRAATSVARRYTSTVDHSSVRLACDDELKPGNDYAKAKQWGEAYKQWQGAQLKKNPSDQTYNLAVAKEVMAYEEYARTQNLEAMLPRVQEALGLYGQAQKADPTEKYIREQLDRITSARDHIETARKIRETQKLEEDRARDEARKAIETQRALERRMQELEVAANDTAPDSTDEAEFRGLARLHIANFKGEWNAQETRRQIDFGQQTYQLTEMRSARVVLQEVKRKQQVAQKIKTYQDAFAPLVSKGSLQSSERAQMIRLQARLGLEQQEVKDIESQYKFTEVGTAASKTPATATKAPPSGTPKKKVPATPAKPGPTPAPAPAAPATTPGIGGTKNE
jgi:hypothetical protein